MTVDGVETINMATFDFHCLLGREEVQVHTGCSVGTTTANASPPPSPSP